MSERPGEFELIERIRASLGGAGESLIKGIGDDCAVTEVRPGYQLLSTIDVLVEGVHFIRSYITPEQLGHKALAVNLSDIAAMGGIPRHALVSLCLPEDVDREFVDRFYEGMSRLATSEDAAVIGGNISSSPQGLVVNVVLLGEVEEGKALLRSGAGAENLLFVTGDLGLSAAGVELLGAGQDMAGAVDRASMEEAVNKHLTPAPRVKEGRRLLESGCVKAAIDISDGIASDLRHLCNESGVGAIIYADKLPVAGAVYRLEDVLSEPPLNYALYGGEEYELLAAVEKDRAKELKSMWGGDLAPFTEVGKITTRNEGVTYIDGEGNRTELPPAGWDHLKSGGNP